MSLPTVSTTGEEAVPYVSPPVFLTPFSIMKVVDRVQGLYSKVGTGSLVSGGYVNSPNGNDLYILTAAHLFTQAPQAEYALIKDDRVLTHFKFPGASNPDSDITHIRVGQVVQEGFLFYQIRTSAA
jgi:hypothetical protein